MRLIINMRGMDLDRGFVEERLRLGLGGWSSRIRRAKVYFADMNGPKGGLDRRCSIDASLIPSGRLVVTGLENTTENAIRSATRRLVRRLRDEVHRRHTWNRVSSGRRG